MAATNLTLKTGDLVMVDTDGGKPGMVTHVCRDGMIGVSLVNEGRRVDEWHPTQVRPVSPKEAAAAAMKFVKVG